LNMKDASVIVITGSTVHKPSICQSIPSEAETILVYQGQGSMGRCRNIGADLAHKPLLIFIDDDVEFETAFLQKQTERIRSEPRLIVTMGWRQWEAPTVLITHRDAFDRVKFDPSLYLLESLDFLLRANEKGFKIDTPKSPYDEHVRAFFDMPDAWFWYQFNQVEFILKHRHIPRNAFNPYHETNIIKPAKFLFNPTTVRGVPTFYKSRRMLVRWMGVLYYGTKKLLKKSTSGAFTVCLHTT